MDEVLGLSISHVVWMALESSFSHRSKIYEIHLKDDLQHLRRGFHSVIEYSCYFKAHCDQLVIHLVLSHDIKISSFYDF